MAKSWKRNGELAPDPSRRPRASVGDAIAQFFWGGAWYERDLDGYWYLTGGEGIMVGIERRGELERAWKAAGNVAPPVPEL